jgi:thiol-disulfide isomerase/thioredoxin
MTRCLLLCLALALIGCSDPAPAPTPTPAPTDAPTPRPAASPGSVTVQKLPIVGARPTPEGNPREGKPKRWLGITVANMKAPIEGAPEDRRSMITRALRGGPADLAGLKRDDVLLRANGDEVLRYQDYLTQARKTEIGQSIDLVVLRDGAEVAVSLTMIEKPADNNTWRKTAFPGTSSFDYDIPLLRGGDRFTSKAGEGKVQLLYFWATWCGPCRKTSPWIDALKEQAGDAIHVVGISSEELEKLKPFVDRAKGTYPIAHDDEGTVKMDYEVNKLPTAVLIDAEGTVRVWDIGTGGVRRAIREARTLLNLPEPAPKAPSPAGAPG